MNAEDAEEFTQTLEQITSATWRQIDWADRQGIPAALGLELPEWVSRIGGYVRLSLPDRQDAVAELVAEGRTQREIAAVLGVANGTVAADAKAAQKRAEQTDEPQVNEDDAAQKRAEAAFEQAAAITDVLETVKTERRPKRPTVGVAAHPAAAFLWGRLGEVRDLDATDAAEEQRGDVIEALDKWAEQLGRLREEVSP